ncbi:ABC transporter permease [Aneurinibacillus sp. REN35]|uniref:ABC transporter permease n=1 Tax=Aneurinibacillus sp. REN35 TaxID=3237286 RepID=UPI0035276F2E
MWIIAKLTWREILSKRIFHITLFMSFAFLLFYGIATYYAAQEAAEGMSGHTSPADFILAQTFFATQLLGIGLYFAAFITALLAILSSVGSIASDIESHQIDMLLARPLRRRSIVLGKFVGLGILLVAYAVCLFLGVLGINQWLGGEYLRFEVTTLQVIKSLATFIIQPLLLAAVALLFSSMMTTVNGGIILIVLYGISFIGGFVEQLGVLMEKTAMINMGIISSLIFPLDSLFRKMTIYLFDTAGDPLSFATQGLFGSLSTPSNLMIFYALLYGAAALWLSIRYFAARDV